MILRPRLFVMFMLLLGLTEAARPPAEAAKKTGIRIVIPGGDPTAFVFGATWTPVAGDVTSAWPWLSEVTVTVTDTTGGYDVYHAWTDENGQWDVLDGVWLPTPEQVEIWGLISATVSDGYDYHTHSIKFVMLAPEG